MPREQLDVILTAAEEVLGLSLCIHVTLPRGTGGAWGLHRSSACLAMKRRDRERCRAFDGERVHAELASEPAGRIHTCPHGLTELVVPLVWEGQFLGILFAGQIWQKRGGPPHPGLIVRPGKRWLESRLVILRAIAAQVVESLRGSASRDRRAERIRRLITRRLSQPITVGDVAAELHLSESRARHLVRDLFGITLTELVQQTKLAEAARFLVIGSEPVGTIAQAVGYLDQGYFTRLFRRRYSLTPSAYRKSFEQLDT
ncbi:MAG: helix-turn-helix transcriptional regulator [Planctomycetota bacterium]|jgi:AraC-like DNA-binding protein